MGDVLLDWGDGLPNDVLALLASLGGIDAMKAMRGVNKTWQAGFKLAIKSIRVPSSAPGLPGGEELAARFPELSHLDIGDSTDIRQEWLQNLVALRNLRSLALGSSQYSQSRFSSQVRSRATTGSLARLQGLPLTSLDLSNCANLGNSGLEVLRGMPLTQLNLEGCTSLHNVEPNRPFKEFNPNYHFPNILGVLHGMPLSTLNLLGCPGLVCDSGFKLLQGLPLTQLSFSGKEPFCGTSLSGPGLCGTVDGLC